MSIIRPKTPELKIIGANMSEPKTIKIVLKDDEKRMSHKFLVYDQFEASSNSEIIKQCVDEAKKSFDGEPDSTQVKIDFDYLP